jgi:putative transposase
MPSPPVFHTRHRFPAEIIGHAVWLYHVFGLSLSDVELILAERGVVVTREYIWHWCRKFGAAFAQRLRWRRPQPRDTRHRDEVFSCVSVSDLATGDVSSEGGLNDYRVGQSGLIHSGFR